MHCVHHPRFYAAWYEFRQNGIIMQLLHRTQGLFHTFQNYVEEGYIFDNFRQMTYKF